jgi:hypothetical protein
MTNLQPSSASNWVAKLIPTITTVCLTLGAVAIYDSQRNDSIQLTNETGSNAALSPSSSSQIPGPQGPAGAQGDTGPQGPKGDAGATGATGAAGEKGDKGATGATGPAGAKGATGATGPAGPQGAIGPVGPAGPAGSSGSGGGSWMIPKDVNNVSVSNVMDVDPEYVMVFKNNRIFRYLRDDLPFGEYGGIPRGWRISAPFYLNSDCTGSIVAPAVDTIHDTISILVLQSPTDNARVYPSNKIYKVGNLSTQSEQLYWTRALQSAPCEPYMTNTYYPMVEIPISELPPTLASPIRLSSN